MNTDKQFEDFEKAFYNDGFQLGMKAIEAGADNTALFSAIGEMYSAIDGFIDSFSLLAQQQEQAIECKLGCEWCCHQPVFALDYELNYLNDYIKNYLDEKSISEIKIRAKRKQQKLAQLKDDKLLNTKHACPLLSEGACIAYEARPVACRIYLSSSVKTCLQFYKVPDDKNNYPALMDLPMRLGRMMNEGFKTALKMSGIDPKEYRIEEKIPEN